MKPVAQRPAILVCEDDTDTARILAMLLEVHGYEADIVHTIAEVRRHLQSKRYRAMTLDLRLPDGNGADLLRELRARAVSIPVVVISAFIDDAKASLGKGYGVVAWMEKPFDDRRLLAVLDGVVEQRLAA